MTGIEITDEPSSNGERSHKRQAGVVQQGIQQSGTRGIYFSQIHILPTPTFQNDIFSPQVGTVQIGGK